MRHCKNHAVFYDNCDACKKHKEEGTGEADDTSHPLYGQNATDYYGAQSGAQSGSLDNQQQAASDSPTQDPAPDNSSIDAGGGSFSGGGADGSF